MRLFILFLFVCNIAFADVYVLVNQDNTIQSIDADDSAVVEKGQTKKVIKGSIDEYSDLAYPDSYYVLQGNKIKLNSKKLEEEAKKESAIRKQQEREAKIQERIKKIAEQQLIEEGIIKAEVE